MQISGAFRIAVFFGLAIAVQWFAGAYRSEASGDPDEPAHLVTGLMAGEYLRSGWGESPLSFARDYYLHYPKVAIGHWPPVFYAEQALWTLIFPASRSSVLVMIALELALMAWLVWLLIRDRFGAVAAWIGALVLLTLPGLATQSTMVMTEVPLALLILLAMLSWGRYLDNGHGRDALLFGVWSAVAILTKGTGIVLAGVPLLSVLLAGRWDLPRRMSFWSPALVVAICCAPWYLTAPGALQQRLSSSSELMVVTRRIRFPLLTWASYLGWVVALLALVGLAVLFYRRLSLPGKWLSAGALILTSAIAPIFVRSWTTRHVSEVAPAFVLVAALGVGWIASWPIVQKIPARMALLAVGAAFVIGWNLTGVPQQEASGYRQLTEAVVDGAFGASPTILISGGVAEGVFIMEMAQKEQRRRPYIVRGTKLFADITWLGEVTGLRVASVKEVSALLDSVPIDLVIIDRVSRDPFAYQPLLEQAMLEPQWQPLEHAIIGTRISGYRRRDAPARSSLQIEAQLRKVLRDPAR